mmetsp:Transcript_29548/g.71121  ORF Transcript_29548/g.71121 Transcript_29548/m.71121 type:complete len:252 (+) Transcript_29548:2-757(+)
MGDCLLHSVSLATNGTEDLDLGLRKALTRALKTVDLYPRWREARAREAAINGYRADDWQWRKEWAELSRAAQTPRSSLEQTHVWALAHVLRRPVIMYAVHRIRNFKDEVVGVASHRGIYLPLLLDPAHCSPNPLALAYVRGHYVGLVGSEQEASGASRIMLPLTTPDNNLLPLHFLLDHEVGQEGAMVSAWLSCCSIGGVLCAEQRCEARARRPQPCQALLTRYTQDLRRRFSPKGPASQEEREPSEAQTD